MVGLLPVNIWDFYDTDGRLRPVETWTSARRAEVAGLRAMLDHHQEGVDAETLRLLVGALTLGPVTITWCRWVDGRRRLEVMALWRYRVFLSATLE